MGSALRLNTGDLLRSTRQSSAIAAAHDLLSATHGDTLAGAVARGSLVVGNATPRWSRLAIGAAGRFLRSDGTDPSWQTVAASDITGGAALTRTNDTNVTLTLGGSPATALLAAASLTLGWSGQLAIARGGHGASTALGGFDALSPLTTRGDLLTRDAANNVRLAVGASGRFLRSDGTDPSWQALASGDIPAHDHGIHIGLSDDDHAIYLLLAGRTGTTNDPTLSTSTTGTLYGSSASGAGLNLQSTSHATRGLINLVDEGRLRTSLTTVGAATAFLLNFDNAVSFTATTSQLFALRIGGTLTHSSGGFNAHRLFMVDATLTNSGANTVIPTLIALNQQPTFTAAVAGSVYGGTSGSVFIQPTFGVTGAGTWASLSHTGVNCALVHTSGTMLQCIGITLAAHTGAGTVTTFIGADIGALVGATLTAGVRSAITSGSGKWFLLGTGNADSSLAGRLFVGGAASTVPNVDCDVDGDLATRAANLALATGNNDNIAIGARSFIRITGPAGAFAVRGIASGFDGKRLVLYNTTTQNMTINHEDAGSTAANRIRTMTGAAVATVGEGAAELIYDATLSRWLLIAMTSTAAYTG